MLLLLQAADEFVHRIERVISSRIVSNVINWRFVVSQNVAAEVDGASITLVKVAEKLGIQAVDGMTQSLVRRWMNNDNFVDGNVALEKQVQRECYDLRLPAQGRQQGTDRFWHTLVPHFQNY